MKSRCSCVLDSPIGKIRLVANDAGLEQLLFGEDDARETTDARAHPILAHAARELSEYFAGARTSFDVPLATKGTPFQARVWSALREIPFGETRSYGAIATRIGAPGASRAVGAANHVNPIGIIVPCHRVIGANGALTGYAGGLDTKRWLLAHERRVAAAQIPFSLSCG